MATKEVQPQQPKNTDSKGRVTLGRHFANRTVLVSHVSENEVVIKLARVIPEDEIWLHQNVEAMNSVQRGLEQASRGQLAKSSPDLDADAEFASSIPDDQ